MGVALGVLLMLAPAMMGYSFDHIAFWNSRVVGVIAAGLEWWGGLAIHEPDAMGNP